MPHTRPVITEITNPAYVEAERKKAIARKAAFSYQKGELGPPSDLPPMVSLAEKYKEEI